MEILDVIPSDFDSDDADFWIGSYNKHFLWVFGCKSYFYSEIQTED